MRSMGTCRVGRSKKIAERHPALDAGSRADTQNPGFLVKSGMTMIAHPTPKYEDPGRLKNG